ncbi:hypothetical protein T439DRAFT_355781 [Meredithblackwellia eburnea MCA 4105]
MRSLRLLFGCLLGLGLALHAFAASTDNWTVETDGWGIENKCRLKMKVHMPGTGWWRGTGGILMMISEPNTPFRGAVVQLGDFTYADTLTGISYDMGKMYSTYKGWDDSTEIVFKVGAVASGYLSWTAQTPKPLTLGDLNKYLFKTGCEL